MSKRNFAKNISALAICVIILLGSLSGCSYSKKLRADMGFSRTQHFYYFVEWDRDGSIVCKSYADMDDYFQKYECEKSIFSPEGVDKDLVNSTPDGVYMDCINPHFVIVTYKYDRMHYNRLFKHLADQLLYLNPDTLNVEMLYQSKCI